MGVTRVPAAQQVAQPLHRNIRRVLLRVDITAVCTWTCTRSSSKWKRSSIGSTTKSNWASGSGGRSDEDISGGISPNNLRGIRMFSKGTHITRKMRDNPLTRVNSLKVFKHVQKKLLRNKRRTNSLQLLALPDKRFLNKCYHSNKASMARTSLKRSETDQKSHRPLETKNT